MAFLLKPVYDVFKYFWNYTFGITPTFYNILTLHVIQNNTLHLKFESYLTCFSMLVNLSK